MIHGWTAERYMKLVDSCTCTDPTSKVDKLVTGYGKEKVKHDLSVLCQSLFWTEIDVEVV